MLTIEEVEEGELVQWGREVAPDMYEELSVGEIITVGEGTEGEDEGGKWKQVSSICFKKIFHAIFCCFLRVYNQFNYLFKNQAIFA